MGGETGVNPRKEPWQRTKANLAYSRHEKPGTQMMDASCSASGCEGVVRGPQILFPKKREIELVFRYQRAEHIIHASLIAFQDVVGQRLESRSWGSMRQEWDCGELHEGIRGDIQAANNWFCSGVRDKRVRDCLAGLVSK